MRKNKSLFDQNLNFLQYAKSFEKFSPVIGYIIKNYGIQNIFNTFQHDKNCLNEQEKRDLSKNIKELKTMKDNLGSRFF